MLPSQYLEIGWTQGNYAIDELGLEVPLNSNKACAWCLAGAISASYHDGTLDKNIVIKFNRAIFETIDQDFSTWNDNENRTQQEIIDLVKEVEQELSLFVK